MEKFIENFPPMDLMRSEKMTLVQLIIPAESSHRAVSYLGELGLLQFRDVSFSFWLRSDSVSFRICFFSLAFFRFGCRGNEKWQWKSNFFEDLGLVDLVQSELSIALVSFVFLVIEQRIFEFGVELCICLGMCSDWTWICCQQVDVSNIDCIGWQFLKVKLIL